MVILVVQGPWPLCPPGSSVAPRALRATGAAPGLLTKGLHQVGAPHAPTAAAGGLTGGITGAKEARLQSWKEKHWKRWVCGGCQYQG